jgi:hypothetical protein
LLLLCLSIIRGHIDDCEFILKLFINIIVFLFNYIFIVISQPDEIGCVSDDGRRM